MPLHWFIWNQHNDQLPVGLLAQLAECCIGITEVMSSHKGLNFYSGLTFTTAQVVFITAKLAFIFKKSEQCQRLSDYTLTPSPSPYPTTVIPL